MSAPHAHISLITLGVADVERSARFYAEMGFARKVREAGSEVAFFEAGGAALSLYGREALAADAGLTPAPEAASAARGMALAWNCPDEKSVDIVIDMADRAGATILKAGHRIFWGGYVGFFTDPDGHLWEVAHNPHFPLSAQGRISLPD